MKNLVRILAALTVFASAARASAEEPSTTTSPPALPEPIAATPSTSPSPPSNQLASATPEQAVVAPPLVDASKREFFKASLGFRVGFVGDTGLDPFAGNDALAGVSLGFSRTLAKLDNLSFALGAAYDGGGRGNDARNLDAKLAWHRLTVPIEGRYHILPMLYGFVRVSPGAHLSIVSIQDPSAPSRLATSGWSFATDVSLGASVLLGPHRQKSRARVWLTPEVGYMATTDLSLALSPRGREDPRPTSSTDLGSLGMRGPFMRVTMDLSF